MTSCFSSAAHLLAPLLQTRVVLPLHRALPLAQYEAWATVWIGRPSWRPASPAMLTLPDLVDEEAAYVASYMQMSLMLFEQVWMPVFDRIVLRAVERQSPAAFALHLDVALLDVVPEEAYRTVFKAALHACEWMAQRTPSAEHREQLFQLLEQRVCAPLRAVAPAGASSMPVLKVAHAMGVPFMHLGAGIYQLGWGSKARRMDRSATDLDSAIGCRLAGNKAVGASLLRLAGLPAPVHEVAGEAEEAVAAAVRLGFPVVLKPLDRERGEGVTVDVHDADAVRRAFAHAAALSKIPRVIVERQVHGVCHRLFIANGRLLYAVRRQPMAVRGDGRRSVANLVNDELAAQLEKPVWERTPLRPIDARAVQALASAGLSTDAVPAAGVLAPLRRIESTEDGGVDEDVTHDIHPDNLAAALEAARLFGLQVAGIDIIADDISLPWHAQDAIINEVNFAPLFGGGEISRSHIPQFLRELMNGDGRIPVEACAHREAALARVAQHRSQGRRCVFTSARETLDDAGHAIAMPFEDLRRRVHALVLRRDVDAIVTCP